MLLGLLLLLLGMLVGGALFLCAAESAFITGQSLVVDGGAQMH